MSTIYSIISFILILSVIVIVHELGHLIAAKKFGVYCTEFSIGMGPVIFQHQFKETAFSIRLLPIGGFVAMVGEDGVDEENKLDVPFERTLQGVAKWKQIIIMAAGAIMNVLLAWALFIGVVAAEGEVVIDKQPVIQTVLDGQAAEKAGLQAGDTIIKMSHGKMEQQIHSWNDVRTFMIYNEGQITVTVLRDGKEFDFPLTPSIDKESKTPYLGVEQDMEKSYAIKKIGFIDSISYGTSEMIESTMTIFKTLSKLVQGVGLQHVSGPVGIYQVTSEITKSGWIATMSLIALLSVNIGIFNLLPIPILDGGRILVLCIEALLKRKLSERVQNAIMMVGLAMLLGIMIFATWNDLSRIFFN